MTWRLSRAKCRSHERRPESSSSTQARPRFLSVIAGVVDHLVDHEIFPTRLEARVVAAWIEEPGHSCGCSRGSGGVWDRPGERRPGTIDVPDREVAARCRGVDRPAIQLRERKPRNSSRTLVSAKEPRIAEVMVSAPCFWTPRISTHKCRAWMTTITPNGWSLLCR